MRASESFPSFSDDDLDEDEMIRAGDRVSGSPVAAMGQGEMGSRARFVAPVDARAEARAEARGGEVSEDDAVFERMEGEYAQLSLQPGRREEEEGEDVDDWGDIYLVDYVDEDEDDDEEDDEAMRLRDVESTRDGAGKACSPARRASVHRSLDLVSSS